MDTLSHAYIVVAPKGAARDEACLRLAMARVCAGEGPRPCGQCAHCKKAQRGVHPDILTVGLLPDKKELLVDQVRDLLADCVVMPNEAEGKAYIIEDADKMNARAQNAFLKQLEEPPRGVTFILAVENAGALLPTVRSRCMEITAAAQRKREPDAAAGALAGAVLDAALEADKLRVISLLLGAEQPSREQFDEFVDALYLLSAERLKHTRADDVRARKLYTETAALVMRMAAMRAVNVSQGSLSGLIAVTLNAI